MLAGIFRSDSTAAGDKSSAARADSRAEPNRARTSHSLGRNGRNSRAPTTPGGRSQGAFRRRGHTSQGTRHVTHKGQGQPLAQAPYVDPLGTGGGLGSSGAPDGMLELYTTIVNSVGTPSAAMRSDTGAQVPANNSPTGKAEALAVRPPSPVDVDVTVRNADA